MAKSVRISFALKTPAQMAKRLGISSSRLGRLLTIANNGSSNSHTQSKRVAFKSRSHAANSHSARRRNGKATC